MSARRPCPAAPGRWRGMRPGLMTCLPAWRSGCSSSCPSPGGIRSGVNARRLELLLADPATAPHGGGVLVIDDSGDRKDGVKTAHVGHQWLGRYGKTDNGVVTVTTVWADERLYYPVHAVPYSPARHFAKGRTTRRSAPSLLRPRSGSRVGITRQAAQPCPTSTRAALPQAQEGAVQVSVQHAVPLTQRHVRERLPAGRAGVGDQAIEAAEPAERRPHGAGNGVLVADVALQAERRGTQPLQRPPRRCARRDAARWRRTRRPGRRRGRCRARCRCCRP